MKSHPRGSLSFAPVFAALALVALAPALQAQLAYRQKNLVSDLPGVAQYTDANLVNPWGIASGPATPFWVSNAGAGNTTLYNTAGTPLPLVVSIPHPAGGPAVPTGQVFNGSATSFNGNRFIFADARGTIAGWRPALGPTAETMVNNSAAGASYLGVATATSGSNDYLYAANFTQGRIDAFSSTNAPASLTGSFTDPTLPIGYAPFNIQNLGGSLYVTYAKVNDEGDEEETGAGFGFVNRFDTEGNLLGRVASNGVLNAPWGLAIAPATGFGPFDGSLLVGNFGDGTINAFDLVSGDLLGTLKDSNGNPLVIEGLWGLRFGNGGAGGKPGTLYFAAGIQDETHGLFGSISPVPEPSTYAAFAAVGLIAVIMLRRRRAAKPVVT